jgi:hypothetical protein
VRRAIAPTRYVTEIDMPAFVAGIRIAAAGKFGHAPLKRSQGACANRPMGWVRAEREPLPIAGKLAGDSPTSVWVAGNGRAAAHIPKMANVRTGMPLVEVTAPDGNKSLWVAAVGKANAVAAVKQVIPPNYVAALSRLRLTITRKAEILRPGEVRRVKL